MAAATALIDAGAAEVLLFGSVARGDAGPHSDIDLVAIFADLEYAERHVRQRELQAAASEAVPCPVQVFVTDRPEWHARVERVPTSLEHRAAGEAVVVATASACRPVDWKKGMVLPMSDPQEALRRFDHRVLPRLADLANATRQGIDEDDPSPTVRERARLNRMVRICTAAALTAETSLKALAVLGGVPTPSEKDLKRIGHDIADVLALVPPPTHAEAAVVFDRLGVDLGALSAWRWRGTYPDDIDFVRADADRLAAPYAVMAPAVAGVLAAHLQQALASSLDLVAAVAEHDRLAGIIAAHDVRRGVIKAAPSPTVEPRGLNG